MNFIIIVNPRCVRGRLNDLLEGLRKDVTILMITVHYSNIIQIKIRKEKKLQSRRNQP